MSCGRPRSDAFLRGTTQTKENPTNGTQCHAFFCNRPVLWGESLYNKGTMVLAKCHCVVLVGLLDTKDYKAPKAQDAELWLKCEIPLDAISASNSFDTTVDQCRSVQTMTIPINGKQNIHLLKWRPCVFHVPTIDQASVPHLVPSALYNLWL